MCSVLAPELGECSRRWRAWPPTPNASPEVLEEKRRAEGGRWPADAKHEGEGVGGAEAAAHGQVGRDAASAAVAGEEGGQARLGERRELRRGPDAPLHHDGDEDVIAWAARDVDLGAHGGAAGAGLAPDARAEEAVVVAAVMQEIDAEADGDGVLAVPHEAVVRDDDGASHAGARALADAAPGRIGQAGHEVGLELEVVGRGARGAAAQHLRRRRGRRGQRRGGRREHQRRSERRARAPGREQDRAAQHAPHARRSPPHETGAVPSRHFTSQLPTLEH